MVRQSQLVVRSLEYPGCLAVLVIRGVRAFERWGHDRSGISESHSCFNKRIVVSLVMLAIGAGLLFAPGMVLRMLPVVNKNSTAAQRYVQRLEGYGGRLRVAGAIAFGWGWVVAYLIVKALVRLHT